MHHTHLARLLLPHHALRTRLGLQRVVKAEPPDVGVRAHALDARHVGGGRVGGGELEAGATADGGAVGHGEKEGGGKRGMEKEKRERNSPAIVSSVLSPPPTPTAKN